MLLTEHVCGCPYSGGAVPGLFSSFTQVEVDAGFICSPLLPISIFKGCGERVFLQHWEYFRLGHWYLC